MYHHSDRKNRLFFIGYIPIQSIRFCIPKLPCGGGPCSRIISCLQHICWALVFGRISSFISFPFPLDPHLGPYHSNTTFLHCSISTACHLATSRLMLPPSIY